MREITTVPDRFDPEPSRSIPKGWSMMSSQNRFALFDIMPGSCRLRIELIRNRHDRTRRVWSMMSSQNRFALFGIML